MTKLKKIKAKLFQMMVEIVTKKVEEAKTSIISGIQSRDNESKSSMGDKYETGRAMIQIEIEKCEFQLQKAIEFQNELARINLDIEHPIVNFGALVFTNQENYFISIALGKLPIDELDFYAISLSSPIGQFLMGMKKGDTGTFHDRNFKIENIV